MANMKNDSESDEEGLRYELIGGGGGGGPHWTRTQGETVEKGGRLTRKVVEKSPGGTHCVTLEHDATPAGGEDPKEKARRAARNKQASRRARKSLNIEVRCDPRGHHARHAATPPRKHATKPQRVLHYTAKETQARRDQDADWHTLKRAAEVGYLPPPPPPRVAAASTAAAAAAGSLHATTQTRHRATALSTTRPKSKRKLAVIKTPRAKS
jgi:hypothetical protein